MGNEGAKYSKALVGIYEKLQQIRQNITEGITDENKRKPLVDTINSIEKELRQLPRTDVTDREKDFSTEGAKKECAELKATLQRVQADFENTCKRVQREKQDFRQVANAELMKELLQLLDSMDAAVGHLQKQENVSKEDALNGIVLLRKQFLALLQGHGLQEIRALGQQFNPMLHEALAQGSEQGKRDSVVLEELQKGFLLNGKVLRHSKVKVNRADEQN